MKYDNDFITAFIQECIASGKDTPAAICNEAEQKILAIDKQLQLRIKLVGVLKHFKHNKKSTPIKREIKAMDKSLLEGFLSKIPNDGIELKMLIETLGDKKDTMDIIKHLLLSEVIIRDGEIIRKANAIL